MSRTSLPPAPWFAGTTGVALLATAIVGLGDLRPRMASAVTTSAERQATLQRVVDRDDDCLPDRSSRRAPDAVDRAPRGPARTVDPEEI
ncbi:MAG: hypothetical protein M0P31_04700 [Solirubrobacteraceae bacterium]|nr:hypothetical protein [Solirubrobacteraceae bacterium]